jgi:hypothetical protein
MPPTRRRLLTACGALAGLAALPRALAVVPKSERLDFEALRDRSPLGWHRLRFRREGDLLHVEIAIDFEVSFAFLIFYRYRHRNHEVWQGDRLVRLDATTDDDGERFEVRARAEGERLLVEGSGGRLELPGDTLTTSYWHERTVERGEWLNTQDGRLARSTVTARGIERIKAGGREVDAARYTLEGDIDSDLWYRDSLWAKLRFQARGSTIEYVLQPEEATL